jgi:monofunctional glycosyltransferase
MACWHMAWKSKRKRTGRWWRLLVTIAVTAFALALLLPVVAVLVFRFVQPPITPLMAIRATDGATIEKHWTPLDRISANLQRAVMASEDSRFCEHHGFDWQAIDKAIDRNADGGRLYGASTISQQTAKNLLLWPSRTFLRKGAEAYVTVLIETLWSKRRILEVYLNIIEWGDGVYGAESAAETYFGTSAAALSGYQSALLAVALPSPRKSDPAHPSRYLSGRAATILGRMRDVQYRRGTVCP